MPGSQRRPKLDSVAIRCVDIHGLAGHGARHRSLLANVLLDCASLQMDPMRLARVCQRAESEFVGVQCGIMDQFIIACGSRDHAMMLDCRSLEYEWVGLPADARFLLVHSGVKRQLSGGSYNSRRDECRQAVGLLTRAQPDLHSLRELGMEQLEAHKAVKLVLSAEGDGGSSDDLVRGALRILN